MLSGGPIDGRPTRHVFLRAQAMGDQRIFIGRIHDRPRGMPDSQPSATIWQFHGDLGEMVFGEMVLGEMVLGEMVLGEMVFAGFHRPQFADNPPTTQRSALPVRHL
ncbi:hypothetical protein AC629_21740 [Bradyrhizobium sp. NAS80.1]|nr:hypothetical protein AC629_21740 [Bradyrhizobium sp. NAS80.1]